MITEKDTIKCEAIFNEQKSHRLYWKRVWNKEKPLACVIMLNPCLSDNIVCDTTTSLVCNNVARLECYGGVIIVNLFSILTNKLQMRWARDIDINDIENDNYIKKAAEEASIIVLAWGRGAELNVRISNRAEQVLELLSKYQEKFRVISDGKRKAIHPLTPTCRSMWLLEPFQPEERITPTKNSKESLAETLLPEETTNQESTAAEANESVPT